MAAQDVPFLAASLLLVGAGLPKLTRPDGVVRAMHEAGLPSSATVGRAIGAVEVVAGVVAITLGGIVPAAAIAAIYAAFAGFLAVALLRGGLASCGCFGIDDSAPSWWHVVVNSALAGTAVAAAVRTAPTFSSLARDSTSTAIALWLLSAITAWLVYRLLSLPPVSAGSGRRVDLLERRRNRQSRVQSRHERDSHPAADLTMSEEPAGELVDIVGTRPDGSDQVVRLEQSTRPTLLAFLSSSCGVCAALWQQFQQRESNGGFGGVDVVVVTKQHPLDDAARIAELAAPGGVNVVMSSSAWDDYDIPGSPYVMIVDGETQSVVAERGVSSWNAVEQLLSATIATASPASDVTNP